MIMHVFAPPSDLFVRLALGGFSFTIKQKCWEVERLLFVTPTFIIEPFFERKRGK